MRHAHTTAHTTAHMTTDAIVETSILGPAPRRAPARVLARTSIAVLLALAIGGAAAGASATSPSSAPPTDAAPAEVGAATAPKKGAAVERPASTPVLEQRVYLKVLEGFVGATGADGSAAGAGAIDDATREKLDVARQAFLARQEAVRVAVAERRKAIEASRTAAPANQPPSEDFRKEMEALRAKQPKLSELQQQVDAILGTERAAMLRTQFEAELARVRKDLAEKAEAERKARRAKDAAATDGDGSSVGTRPDKKKQAPIEGAPQ